MNGIRISVVAAAAVLAVLAGCQGQEQVEAGSETPVEGDDAPGLVAQAYPPVPDLPVPIGFKLNEKRSRNQSAGGFRSVDHLYRGRADKYDLHRFYKRQMRISRWILAVDTFTQGQITMEFQKDNEQCRIVISDGDLFHPSHIKIQVFPTGPLQQSR